MVCLIRAKTINDSRKENGQTDSIMFRIMLMFQNKMWECIVTQINSHNYHFVVHIPNLMAQGGLSKHYHLSFDPKIGNVICAIRRIPCACFACTSMLDKPWISGIPSDEKKLYKPVTNCTYCPVLGSFNNCNII